MAEMTRLRADGRTLSTGGVGFAVAGSYEPYPVAPPAGFDKANYLFFGTAGGPGNTAAQWNDESGHSNHLTNTTPGDRFELTTNAAGKPVYRGTPGSGKFDAPFSAAANELTFYFLLTPASLNQCYLFNAKDNAIVLGYNSTETGAYFLPDGGGTRGYLGVPAGQRTLLVFRLDMATNTGRVYRNGTLLFTADFPGAASQGELATLGHAFTSPYAILDGDLEAFAVRLGLDSDAQLAEASAYFNSL